MSETLSLFTGLGSVSFTWMPAPSIVAADIDAAANKLERIIEPLLLSRNVAQADIREHFDNEESPDGDAWAELSPDYVERRGSAHPILDDTGALKAAATSPGAFQVTGNTLFYDMGAIPDYGMYHQTGYNKKFGGTGAERASFQKFLSESGIESGGRVPARPFAGMSEKAMFEILAIFDEWVTGALGIVVSGSGTAQVRTGGRFGGKFRSGGAFV